VRHNDDDAKLLRELRGHGVLEPYKMLLKARIIIVHDNLDSMSCEDMIENMTHMIMTNREPIRVYITSPGGHVFSGLAVYDYIRTLVDAGIEVYTIGQGYVASMGGILLQAGSKRIMQKNAWMMIHEVSSLNFGKTSELKDEAKFCERLQRETLFKILAERSAMSMTQIKKRCLRKDWWMNAKEVFELGFCDEII